VNLEEVCNFLNGHIGTDGAASAIAALTFQSSRGKKIFYCVYIGDGMKKQRFLRRFGVLINLLGFIKSARSGVSLEHE